MKRTIVISTRGTRLSLELSRVRVEVPDLAPTFVPIEDLAVVVLESRGLSISSGLLAALAEAGVAVVPCDGSHMPVGLLLPLHGHSLHTARVRAQVEAGAAIRKRLWQRLVRAKIQGQLRLLPDGGPRRRLTELARTVRSGDPTNHEGQAAALYWPALLGRGFRRDRYGDPPNGLLNYGYAVLRAAVARALVASGLSTAIGLHHRNRSNPAVLADDLIEPFRPWVDARVADLVAGGSTRVEREEREALLSILTEPVAFAGQTTLLGTAIELSAASLARALELSAEGARLERALEALRLPEAGPQEPPEAP